MPEHAEGPSPLTVVAVHGNGCGGLRFDMAAGHLPPDVRLVAPTLPGFDGRAMPPGGTHSLHPYVDDLAEVVEAASDGPVVLLGQGLGGAIVMHGLTHDRLPEVAGVILHSPGGPGIATQWMPKGLRSVEARDRVRRLLTSRVLRPAVRRVLLPDVDRTVAGVFLDAYRECAAFGTMFDLVDPAWFDSQRPRPDVPACILWGADDHLQPARSRRSFAELLPSATEEVVRGWRHFPMLADPADYATTIAAVARKVAGRHPGPVPLGRGLTATRGGAAARLDEAASEGLPVAPGVLIPDAGHADLSLTARQVAATEPGRVVVRVAPSSDESSAELTTTFRSVVDVDGDDAGDLRHAFASVLAGAAAAPAHDIVVQRHVAL